MECIICMDEISNNDIKENTQLECCNQFIHIECLQKWVQSNLTKNSDINKCFYCKKNNKLINQIVKFNTEKFTELSNTQHDQNNILIVIPNEQLNIVNQNRINHNAILIILIKTISLVLFVLLFCIFMFYVLS